MRFVLIHNLAKVSKTLLLVQNKLLFLCNCYPYAQFFSLEYMNLRLKHIAIAAAALFCACSPDSSREENPVTMDRTFFAKGVDISWATQMEADGMKFYGSDGQQKECTAVMKEAGADAVRLRVWVNPEGGWCGKEDVLEKAKRAQTLGMKIMIDFHYSDTWADPGNQKTPQAWAGYDVSKLVEAVEKHTKDILNTLKSNNISVEWVQVGNEVNSGMLHPLGNIGKPEHIPNFASFINAGSKAVKEVYADAKVILHRSNGYESDGFAWFLNVAKAQNINYDMIGMSLYPSWWENGRYTPWQNIVESCLTNIKSFAQTYGKPVMLCEFGMPVSEPETAAEALQYILDKAKNIKELHGIFYWEPEVYGGWKPSYYDSLGWGPYEMGAFKNGRPTAALDPFKQTIQ